MQDAFVVAHRLDFYAIPTCWLIPVLLLKEAALPDFRDLTG